jgi:hypothetical protein
MGHEERFPPTRLSAGCGFRKETVAGMRRNGRDAPIPRPGTGRFDPQKPFLAHARGWSGRPGSGHSRRISAHATSRLTPVRRAAPSPLWDRQYPPGSVASGGYSDGRAGQGADCLFAAGPRDEIRRVRAAGARSLPQVLDPGGVEFVPALFHLDPGNVAHIATSVFCRPACSCREGNLR